MEYMMIRSMKSGGNPDPSTPTLTMIPDHHHNHHNNHIQHQQQMQVQQQQHQQRQQQQQQLQQQQQHHQQQQQQQQQSLAEQQVNDLYTAMNCGDLSNSSLANDTNNSNWSNNLLGGSIQLQQSVNASSTIPIHFKSTEIYERIVASSSVSTQSAGTVQLSNFGGSSSLNHIIKSENLYGQMAKNHIVQRSTTQQQFVVPSNYQPEQFQSGLVVSNSSTSSSKLKSVKKAKMKVHKRKRKLWEYSYARRSALQVESSKAAASLAAASSNSNNNAVVSLSRKRKASSSSLQSVTKRQKGSWIPVNNPVPSASTKIVKQSSLCSQMPNLLKAFQVPDEADKCCSIKSELMEPKIEKFQSKLAVAAPSRPEIPIENIFLKKYDPIRLLSRLCASRVKSEGGTTVEKKALVGKTFPRVSNKSVPPRLKIERLNSNPFGQNVKTKNHQPSSGLPSCLNSVVKHDSLVKSPTSLSMRCIKKSKSKSNQHLRDNRDALGKRKSSRKLKRKRLRKYPKFVTPKRKLKVKFLSTGNGVPQLRVRVLAAIYLKRALSRLRRGRRQKGRQYTNFHKVKRSHKLLQSPKPPETTAIEVLKTGKGSANYVRKFKLANVKMPKAIPAPTVKVNFPNNQYLYNTIELLRHKRELQDRLENMESDGVVYRLGSLPETSEPVKSTFISQNVMMKGRQVKTLLSERLLINFAHAGFTHTTLRPLEVAADIVADFLMKTAKRLKDVAEVEMMGADHGFPDAMERVLNEMGMGGIRGLEEFYRSKIVDYGQRMEDQCSVLRRQFAYKVRSKVGLGNSTCTSSTPSPTTAATVTVSSGGSGSRPVINTSKTASTSSSQPLSPGNSMLAEILSSQEELSGRTILASSSPSMGEKQLEDLMVAPPNVEIRPNSYHSRQQLPLHQLLASLSQQSHQQVVTQPQLVRAAPPNQVATSPVILNQVYQNQSHQHQQQQQHQQQNQQTQQQSQSNVLQASTPVQYTLANQNSNHQHPSLQSSSQGLHHSQPHLTQLLQRPITNQASPTNHHHPHHQQHPLHHPTTPTQSPQHHHQQHLVIQSPGQVHQSQYQGVPLQAPPASIAQLQNSSNQVNQLRSVVTNNNRPLITMPIQISLGKQGHQSPVLKTEIPSTVPAVQSPSSKPSTNHKPKTVTIIRSNSASSPGIIVSNENRPGSNSSAGGGSTLDVLPEFHSPHGGSNVISINLGSNSIDLDHSNVPQTVTMHAAEPGIIAGGGASTGSSKAKLKEAINQRNLLRLNFEQVPNAGESTVLLSSSSAPVPNATGNVQFVGKVTPGQTITWNSNYQ